MAGFEKFTDEAGELEPGVFDEELEEAISSQRLSQKMNGSNQISSK